MNIKLMASLAISLILSTNVNAAFVSSITSNGNIVIDQGSGIDNTNIDVTFTSRGSSVEIVLDTTSNSFDQDIFTINIFDGTGTAPGIVLVFDTAYIFSDGINSTYGLSPTPDETVDGLNLVAYDFSTIDGTPITGTYLYGLQDFYTIKIGTEVAAVPALPSIWLFVSGLIGLIGIAKRKSRI